MNRTDNKTWIIIQFKNNKKYYEKEKIEFSFILNNNFLKIFISFNEFCIFSFIKYN